MNKLVIVTGGAGFVGHHFVEHLLKNTDWNIAVFDKLSYSSSGFDRIRDINAFDNRRVFCYTIDITQEIPIGIYNETKNASAIFHFAAESVKEDTVIPINNGNRKIEHLYIKDLWKKLSRKNKIYTTIENTEVMNITSNIKSLTIKNGFGQWKKIKQISRHMYKGKMINMSQKWGEIDVTPNHSIYNSNMELVKPSENEELLSIRSIKPFKNTKNFIEKIGDYEWKTTIDDYLFLCAFFITEGSTSFNKANGGYIINFAQNNINDIERICQICRDNFDVNGSIIKRKCSSYNFSNKKLYNLFRSKFGIGSGNKKINSEIFRLDHNLIIDFITYLIYFDGTKYNENFSRYWSNSKILISQLCTLLSLLKIEYTYSKRIHNNKKHNDSYCIDITRGYYPNLTLKKYMEYDYDGYVYDIEVDDTHKFVCGLGNVVVHNSHVDNSIEDPIKFIKSNVLGTGRILNFARLLNNLDCFCLMSTDEVFGPAPEGVNYKEWDRYNCTNPYSATKAGAEELTLAYMNTYSMPGYIIHSMNIFGERQHPEKFIPMCIKKILNGKEITIHSDSTLKKSGSRFYIHARNMSDAMLFLYNNFETRDKYNIVGEREVTNLALAMKIGEILGKDVKYKMVDFHSSRPGHDLRYALDGSKIAQMGWKMPLDFEDSMRKTIEWSVRPENERWIK